MSRTPAKRSHSRSLGELAPEEVKTVVDGYTAIYDASLEHRRERYQSFVNHYYDLATDFYEFGWGQSFHFRSPGTGMRASRHRCSDTNAFSPTGCP